MNTAWLPYFEQEVKNKMFALLLIAMHKVTRKLMNYCPLPKQDGCLEFTRCDLSHDWPVPDMDSHPYSARHLLKRSQRQSQIKPIYIQALQKTGSYDQECSPEKCSGIQCSIAYLCQITTDCYPTAEFSAAES